MNSNDDIGSVRQFLVSDAPRKGGEIRYDGRGCDVGV